MQDRSARVSRSPDRRIFPSAHLTPANFRVEINLDPVHHEHITLRIYRLEIMRARDKCNERKENLEKRGEGEEN